jgi:hypothetical protein
MRDEAVLRREMGCTRAEFLAWLPGAVRGAPVRIEGDLVRIDYAGGEVWIGLAPATQRRAGALSLPVLGVSMRFVAIAAADRDEFLRHFDLFTSRGGG